jgi:type VI secretion system secreted protein Hcp
MTLNEGFFKLTTKGYSIMTTKTEDNNVLKPALYVNLGNIKGTVTESNHKNWIEVSTMEFSIQRNLHTQTGHVANRETSKPNFSSISMNKPIDATGALLAQEACGGKSIPKVIIHLCKTGDSGLVIQQEITLEDVYISSYAIDTTQYEQKASESFSLNFSYIQIKGYPYDSAGKQQTPQTFAYDLKEATFA